MDMTFSSDKGETKKVWDIAVAVAEKFNVQREKTPEETETKEQPETETKESSTTEEEKTPEMITETKESRVIVVADSSWLTDKLLSGKLSTKMEAPNTIAFRDMLSWLVQEPAIAGTVENTKDKTFRPHSKEGQGWLFYGTVLLLPLMIFIFGLLFISRRGSKSKGAA